MLNEFKRPMWNDGPAKQPWLNYFNEYERTHCCFGDDDSEDSEGYGEDTGMTADQAAAAAAAADAAAAAAAAAGGDSAAQAQAAQAGADVEAAAQQGIDVGSVDGGLSQPSMEAIDTLEDAGLIGYNERQGLGYFDKLDEDIYQQDLKQAKDLNAELAAKDLDAQVTVDKQGNYSYTGPDMFSALGGEIGKAATELSPTIQLAKTINEQGGISGVLGSIFDDAKQIGKDAYGAISGTPSASQTLSTLASSDKDLSGLAGIGEYRDGLKGEKGSEGYVSPESFQAQLSADRNAAATANQYAADVLGIDPDAQAYRDALATTNQYATDVLGIDPDAQAYRDALAAEPGRGLDPSDLSYAFAAEPSKAYSLGGYSLGPKTETEADRRNDLIEGLREALSNIRNRKFGGSVKEKRKSAIDKFFAKVSAPSAYSQEPTPMYSSYVTALPPEVITEDLFSTVARERREAAGQTPVFNYDRSAPYSKKLYAASYGLDPATIENVMPTISSTNPMLDALRKNLQERRDKENEEEEEETIDPIVEDDDNYSMYDEEAEDFGGIGSIGDDVDTTDQELTDDWNDDPDAMFAGGGGIRDVLYRQTGGAANPNEYAYIGGVPGWADQFRRRRPPQPFFPGPGHPDYPGTMPPEPPKPEPPPPPPEPKIIYDPVREEAARKRARELQALKIGELDTAPQTTAERLALEKSGGFYRDDAGNVRDASGAFQEDFAYDYTAPPPIDSGPSGDDFNFTGDPDPVPEPPPPTDPTDPIPLPGVDPIYEPIRPLPGPDDPFQVRPSLPYQLPKYNPFTDYTGPKTMADLGNKGMGGSHFTPEFTQYLEGQGYTIDMTPTRMDGAPQIMNQQGQPVTFNEFFNPTMMPQGIATTGGPFSTIGQQLQPTGLQGIMPRPSMQNPNYIPPSTRPVMNQNMQGFGMQSPTPFGTQQPFSSGFGGFGQQPNYNSPYAR